MWIQKAQTILFVATFVAGSCLQRIRPAAAPRPPRRHAARNLALWASFLAISSALGALSALLLVRARAAGWGLLVAARAPSWLALVAGVLIVDATGFALHALSHRLPILWRLHEVHHADPALDITSTYRLHPIEIVVRWALSTPILIAAGVPPLAPALHVLYFCVAEQLLHAAVAWPPGVERVVSLVLVTPGAHRMHHDRRHPTANFGIGLSIWDRLAGTWRADDGRARSFGVEGRDTAESQTLAGMLRLPFTAPLTWRAGDRRTAR
jgi:sterol desaturase/sphingolipid hydroxylase (fatty acid hydroxylase superfamily)